MTRSPPPDSPQLGSQHGSHLGSHLSSQLLFTPSEQADSNSSASAVPDGVSSTDPTSDSNAPISPIAPLSHDVPSLLEPSEPPRTPAHNFSELDFMDSGLGRSLLSDLPVLGLQDELDSLQFDDQFVVDYLLNKLQDAHRRLQEIRDHKSVISSAGSDPNDSNAVVSSPAGRLFVASYRLPLTVKIGDDGRVKSTVSSASLGLVSAFKRLWDRMPIRWLGAPGQTVHDLTLLPPQQRADMERHFKSARNPKPTGLLSYVPIFPDEADSALHQEFCTLVLWPLFHYIPFNLGDRSYNVAMFRAYVRINRFYAHKMIDEWKKSGIEETEAMFWIHDFQLCLVPKMIRDIVPNARIGFFLHIPFPTREVFRALAPRKELLEGMLGADLIGFHTYDYARHFLATCDRVLNLDTSPTSVNYKGFDVQISVYPFGIDTDTFLAAMKQNAVIDLKAEMKASLVGKKVIVGVDRLDYIKGIPQKLLAIEHFLERHPQWIGRVVFLQVTTPSTSESEEYHAFRSEILEMVGRINGRFATIEDTPIHYREVNMTLEQLCALYAGADVAMITSIRDGMNLVSYEYIVCQLGSNGSLILSEFAGAAKNLPGAILVNPWDVDGVSDAILQSLEMTEAERELRYVKLFRHVLKHTSAAWGVTFIDDLLKHSTLRHVKSKELIRLPLDHVCETYREANSKHGKRLFLLDYDGTLRKYESQPELAEPSLKLLKILTQLTRCEQNVVFIITGRQKATMTEWFGRTGVGFAVEHGFSMRWPDHLREQFGGRRAGGDGSYSADTGTEEREREAGDEENGEWKARDYSWDDLLKADELIAMRNALHIVGSVLRETEDSLPGSFVSQKESAYSLHFRDADPTFAQMRALEARQLLEERLAGSPMEVLMGHMILYVRPRGVHKGAAAAEVLRRLCSEGEKPCWTLSIGDDCTDEDMFLELYQFAKEKHTIVNTCTVGRKDTQAMYYVSAVDDVERLLQRLGEIDEEL